MKDGLTVAEVYWDFMTAAKDQLTEKEKRKITAVNKRLNGYAKFRLNSHLYQILGLKTPLELRFYHTQKSINMASLRKELGSSIIPLAVQELKSAIEVSLRPNLRQGRSIGQKFRKNWWMIKFRTSGKKFTTDLMKTTVFIRTSTGIKRKRNPKKIVSTKRRTALGTDLSEKTRLTNFGSL